MDSDAIIQDAWERRIAAYDAYDALPFSEKDGEPYTPDEAAQWAIIDETEETIRAATATTIQGALTQLWTGFGHALCMREDDAAARRRDLAYFDGRDGELDFTERLTLAALRSLTNLI